MRSIASRRTRSRGPDAARLQARKPFEHGLDRIRIAENEIRDGGDVVDRRVRQAGRRSAVADKRDDLRVPRMEERLAVAHAENLDFRDRVPLEALDQDEIDRREHSEEFRERRLRRAAQFAHQGDPGGRGDQHFVRAGGAMFIRVLPRPVDVEAVMGVLDGRDAEAPPVELRDEAL